MNFSEVKQYTETPVENDIENSKVFSMRFREILIPIPSLGLFFTKGQGWFQWRFHFIWNHESAWFLFDFWNIKNDLIRTESETSHDNYNLEFCQLICNGFHQILIWKTISWKTETRVMFYNNSRIDSLVITWKWDFNECFYQTKTRESLYFFQIAHRWYQYFRNQSVFVLKMNFLEPTDRIDWFSLNWNEAYGK